MTAARATAAALLLCGLLACAGGERTGEGWAAWGLRVCPRPASGSGTALGRRRMLAAPALAGGWGCARASPQAASAQGCSAVVRQAPLLPTALPRPLGGCRPTPAACRPPPCPFAPDRGLQEETQQVVGVVAPVVAALPVERGGAPGAEVRRCSFARRRRQSSLAAAAARSSRPQLTGGLLSVGSAPPPVAQSAVLLTGPPILVAGELVVPAAEPSPRRGGRSMLQADQACC